MAARARAKTTYVWGNSLTLGAGLTRKFFICHIVASAPTHTYLSCHRVACSPQGTMSWCVWAVSGTAMACFRVLDFQPHSSRTATRPHGHAQWYSALGARGVRASTPATPRHYDRVQWVWCSVRWSPHPTHPTHPTCRTCPSCPLHQSHSGCTRLSQVKSTRAV